jgi:two-component system KDP operon response regulator KdpE
MSGAVSGHVLLVEDDEALRRTLAAALGAAGYVLSTAGSGAEALRLAGEEAVDVVLLDLGLPDMDGKEVLRSLRRLSEVPVIILSARGLEAEKIAALDLGADDYVEKPVGVGELLARLRAAQRGLERRFNQQTTFIAGPLKISFAERRVWVMDEEMRMTPREFELLRILARHAGRPVTHRQIKTAIWGGDADTDAQTVRVLVAQLRLKLEENPSSPRLVLTEPGVGYRLVSDPVAPA